MTEKTLKALKAIRDNADEAGLAAIDDVYAAIGGTKRSVAATMRSVVRRGLATWEGNECSLTDGGRTALQEAEAQAPAEAADSAPPAPQGAEVEERAVQEAAPEESADVAPEAPTEGEETDVHQPEEPQAEPIEAQEAPEPAPQPQSADEPAPTAPSETEPQSADEPAPTAPSDSATDTNEPAEANAPRVFTEGQVEWLKQAVALEKKALEDEKEACAARLKRARERVRDAKRRYREARDSRRAARPKREGGRGENVSPRVRFELEVVEDGVKVTVKGRPETADVLPFEALRESVNKAAYAFTDRYIGPREDVGNKGGSLSNRLRQVLAKLSAA